MIKKAILTARQPLAAAVLLLGAGTYTQAQTAPAATPATDPASPEEVVVLSPFVVSAADAKDGYQVKDTLGGTRVRTDMSDVASSISVVSKKLLEDTGITNAQGLLNYTTNTEVAGLNGSFSGVAARGFGVQGTAENGRLGNPNAVNRARGLTAMDNTRNYFLTEIPWDSFNINRVDISRGPNSFLFGVGSPSGISNYSTNEAVFKDQGALEFRYGSFGTHRESLDYNMVLLPDELAARIDLLNDDTMYRQKPAYNHAQRAYAALRYDPKFLNSESAHTSIKINAEYGRDRSNNPRVLPPVDYITGYFDGVVNKAGYNPFAFSNVQTGGVGSFTAGQNNSTVTLSPWVNGSDIHYIWPGPGAAFWYDAQTGQTVDAMTTLNGANATDLRPVPSGYLASMPQAMPLYVSGFSNYAKTVNLRDSSMYPGAYAATVIYGDKSLTDRSIFDFYNKLIDGDTKREWQNWKTFNIVAEQSLFKNRLSLQATYDHQAFDFGSEGLLSGYMQPYISVDLDSYKIVYAPGIDGAVANPNVGRPFIASDFGSSNSSTHYVHDNVQLIANGEIRASDFLDPHSTAAKIIGTHSFTGLLGDYRTKSDTRNWSLYATDVAFANSLGEANGLISSLRTISWVAYLGDGMGSKTSASGLGLSNIAKNIAPTSGNIRHFDNTWTAASSVNPADPWTNPADPTGTYQQNDNPANFRGWTTIPATVLNSKDNINDLYQSGTKRLERLKSESFMYQGTMFDGMVMPMAGYRSDTVRQRSSNAPLDPRTHVASMNYSITGEDAVDTTTSKSYGVTLHLPRSLRGNLPLDSDISLHYFHGVNGTPKIRYGFDAQQLPSEHGKTDDFGLTWDAFKGRFSLRVTYFKTQDFNAAAGSGVADPLGANGYMLYLLPAWGIGDAAVTGKFINDNSDSAWGFASVGGAGAPTDLQVAAVNAWKANSDKVFSQAFYSAYGLGVNVNALTTGNYQAVYGVSGTFFPWSIANTGGGKVNGSFPIISQDVESKGWEIESTVRPVQNWDITFNISKVQAVQTALGASTEAFVLAQKSFWDGPAGDLHLWGYWGGAQAEGNTLRRAFYQNVWSAYLAQKAQLNAAQPELRNWNAKAITNYTFTSGALKGFNVGGGLRWASKPILGYGIHQIVDPNTGGNVWITDVSQPLYGKIDQHCDLWVGYERKLSSKVNWRIQLNVQNAFEKARLAPITLEPNGDWAQVRIVEGMTYTLTNTFKF